MKLLLAGESWFKHTIHLKGIDSFTTSEYEEGVKWLREAFTAAGHEFDYIPGHLVAEHFPDRMADLRQYDAVIISDIGAKSFLLRSDTFVRSDITVNRLQLLHDYVEQGGGLLMIGGYMTFQGIEAKGNYHGTPIERCLPVAMLPYDDRREVPEGVVPTVKLPDHEILRGLPREWPAFLGYNRLIAKEGADVLLEADGDPFLAVHEYGKGRAAAFASDCSPHWAPPAFINWDGYGKLWNQLVSWLGRK
jgi:Uncharacterized membrane protein